MNSQPTGLFPCPRCGRETLHRMEAGGWRRGACLECEEREKQMELWPEEKAK